MSQKLASATALYLEGIRDGKVRASVEAYTGARYTQHSTGVRDGVDGFVEFFEPFIKRNPVRDIQICRSIVDGNHVFLHVYQDINNGEARWVTTDMFDTDEDHKIVEHWDVIAAFVGDTNDGPNQIDGPSDILDVERTAENKAVVAGFLEDVLVQRRVEKLPNYISDACYIEHNPERAGGIGEFAAFMRGPGKSMSYDNVFKVIGQGNFVASYCAATIHGGDVAVFDIFRLADGKIVEHWDNMEPIPQRPQPNSGKF